MSARATKADAGSGSGSGKGAFLRVTQVRSGIGTKPKHRATLRALGLRGVGRSRVVADRADTRGMIARVSHLVELEAASETDWSAQRGRQSSTREARRVSQGQVPDGQLPEGQAPKGGAK